MRYEKSTLEVRIEDIPVEGLPISVSEEFLAGEGPQGPFDTRELGIELTDRIRAALVLERIGSALRVKGKVHFPFTAPCARSNEPVPCRFEEPIDLSLHRAEPGPTVPVDKEGEPVDEYEVATEEADEWTYAGEDLDLRPILYEHIALNLPVKVVAERYRDAPDVAWQDQARDAEEAFNPFAKLKGLKLDQ